MNLLWIGKKIGQSRYVAYIAHLVIPEKIHTPPPHAGEITNLSSQPFWTSWPPTRTSHFNPPCPPLHMYGSISCWFKIYRHFACKWRRHGPFLERPIVVNNIVWHVVTTDSGLT